jgi:GNAT superfamily N-acetyltransferase
MTSFEQLQPSEKERIEEMSRMAVTIVREHFDPLIGKEQNDYMISLFQTPSAIQSQLASGCRYYFVKEEGRNIGFLAFYPRENSMYLSKFYLYRNERHKGHARRMLEFVIGETEKEGLASITLNVNRFNSAVGAYLNMGFEIIREEKNDIGNGFFMDDYVMALRLTA